MHCCPSGKLHVALFTANDTPGVRQPGNRLYISDAGEAEAVTGATTCGISWDRLALWNGSQVTDSRLASQHSFIELVDCSDICALSQGSSSHSMRRRSPLS